MKLEFDPVADAAYFEIATGDVFRSEEIKPGVILDFDTDGNVLGVEVLSISKRSASTPTIPLPKAA
jgi:uncharacterized protein YuzE